VSYIVPNNVSLNNLTASNHVSASAFYGDGSGLSNIATGGLTAVSTSGNITGSGTSLDPVGIKPDPLFNTVTASVVTASDVITDYINFNSNADPVWDNGRMWYNNDTHELNYWTEVDGFSIKIGQQLVQRCQNDYPSTTLTKGTVVHITGSTSSDTPRVTIADWTNDNLSANTLGLVAEDIVGGGTGYVIVQGILKEYNTNGFNAGEMLYLSSSGQITNIKPSAPQHTVSIGQVVRKQSSNGSIYVSIQNGYEIGELHDVLTNGKANGDLLAWDSSISAWKNSNVLSGSYTFSGSQTITGSLNVSTRISSSQFTGSFSGSFFGDGSGLTNIPAGTITVGGNITGSGTVVSPYGVNINPLFVNTTSSTVRATNYLIIGTSSNNNYAPNMVQIARPNDCHLTISDTTASVVLGSTKGVPAFPYSYVGTQNNHDFVILRDNTPLVALSSSNFSPVADSSINLGQLNKRWSNIFGDLVNAPVGSFSNYTNTAKLISPVIISPVTSEPIQVSSSLSFASGKGIDFSVTSNGSGAPLETLNDYEVGEFIPLTSSSGWSGTGTITRTGRYTKIGNNVFITIYIEASNGDLDFTQNSEIVGLPFVVDSLPYAEIHHPPALISSYKGIVGQNSDKVCSAFVSGSKVIITTDLSFAVESISIFAMYPTS